MQQQQVFSDRYQLVSHIARGGMAQVYLARDLLLDRPVALKVLFPELSVDRAFVERFRREAKAAANLSHPNIVSIYDWGQGENTYFIVMEYVAGRTLSQMLREGPLDSPHAATIAADVAAALDFAHRHGVIHRDVKPGNVLINESGQVKVADFGIARAIGAGAAEDLTQTGSVMGTATYFSPEQAQGFGVDPRSDVYSLGVVLYEMLAGRAPFTGDSPVSIAYKHVKETPEPIRSINPAVPAGLEAIVMRCLAKQPDDRYPSAEELRADLVRYLQGQPVVASAEPTRVATAVAAGVGAAGIGAAGAATIVNPAAGGTATMPVAAAGEPPPGGPGEHRSRAAAWGAAAAIALLALGIGLFFLGRSQGWWATSTKTLTVPNLVNKPAADAFNQLQQMGFTKVSEQTQSSSSITPGNVIGTQPPAGTQIKSDQPVVLQVSGGPVQVQVPDVVGKSQEQATSILQQAGFTVNVTQQNSNNVTQGSVITTNPPPGTTVGQGSAVQIVVSSGKQQVQVPSVVGQSPSAAGQTLGQLGLQVRQSSEPSSTVPAGEVTRTDPPAGTTVAIGSTVTVYVSTGSPQTSVPNVVGDTQSQAASALSSASLQANFVTVPVSRRNQDGIVQSQDPAGGSTVNQGSTVTVVVGQYGGSTTTSTPTTAPPIT
jgi:beta-lactam-binding protein with PASTA domain/tRNA A-37 threonylcarbamoyl transferase component Bud32